ncbi:Ribosomal protein S6 kinase alpha-2 [Sporothrix curviconia]|uniref:Ribosomal protein S6 kinase alpha-2 n=1 Tax=Sporothrix curviconia TaxID=1260050 RepID=A0ABP0CFK8_9PEZI
MISVPGHPSTLYVDAGCALEMLQRAEIDFGASPGNLFQSLRVSIHRDGKPDGWEDYCNRLAGWNPTTTTNNNEGNGISGNGLAGADVTSGTSRTWTSSPPLQQFFGKYKRCEQLGNGAMGEVYRCIDLNTGNCYAMKQFKETMREEEKSSLIRVDHPHVVKYVDFLLPDTLSPSTSGLLIMEYVQGDNLEQVISSSTVDSFLSHEEIREILYQLLSAVAHLHDHKSTHRDIKPANIVLVSRSPIYIKLVDFGFASDKSRFNTSCGTRLFIAPEVLVNKAERVANNKIDVFAIGVLTMRLEGEMFGLNPRDYHSAKTCCDAVQRRVEQLRESVTPLLPHWDLAMRMLHSEPALRLSAKEFLQHSFFANKKGQDGVSAPISIPPRTLPGGHYRGHSDDAAGAYPSPTSIGSAHISFYLDVPRR